MRNKTLRTVFCVAIIVITGCSTKSRTELKGYSFGDLGDKEAAIASIEIGKTGEVQILNQFGSPSIVSSFSPRTFFYIQRRINKKPLYDYRVNDQQVLQIEFDDDHKVTGVRTYGMKDAVNVPFIKKETEIKDNKLGVLEQFSRNLGRFNSDKGMGQRT